MEFAGKHLKQIAERLAKLVLMPHLGRSKHGAVGRRMGYGVLTFWGEGPASGQVQIGSRNLGHKSGASLDR